MFFKQKALMMITELDKNTALILIDLQQGILDLASNAHAAQSDKLANMSSIPQVLDNAAKLIAAFRQKALPIVVVNVNSFGAPWTASRKEMVNKATTPPSADFVKIHETIQTSVDDIFITKNTWSAFFNTGLHQELQKRQVTNIVLGGVATSIGVEGTARDASVLGYNLSFAADAMSDFMADAHQHSSSRIFPRIGEVGHTQDILDKLLKY